MTEDVEQTVETEPTEEETTEAPERTEASQEERIAGLEAALAERDARIRAMEEARGQSEGRIAEVEEALSQRDSRVQELEATLGLAEDALKERGEEVEYIRGQLGRAVALYRASLLAAEPEIPQELVQGTTVDEVEASLVQARQMVEQVRSQLEAQASQERVPFGAPVRSASDLSALSAQEKICWA